MKPKITLLLAFAFLSCKETLSRQSIDAEQFTDLYITLLENKTQLEGSPTDAFAIRRASEILKTFKVTEEEYRATIQGYNADVSRWNEFYKRVVQRLEEHEQKKIAR